MSIKSEAITRPGVYEWKEGENDVYFTFKEDLVLCDYTNLGIEKDSPFNIFRIEKNHYKQKMNNIIHHINYFITFYDTDKEFYLSIFAMKILIDTHPEINQSTFKDIILERVITDSFIAKTKAMMKDLYTININTDSEGKYKNTPKINNNQAEQIVALSFAFRFILPLCIHYSNIGLSFKTGEKTQYLNCFHRIFYKIIKRFEENDIPIYTALCRFIDFRVRKAYNNNRLIFYQKKQLRGDSIELYGDELIHRVIIVKSLYKLDYRKSCVSFIDGIISKFNSNYGVEKYPNKPYEIDSSDLSPDNDDYLSRAEALEMQSYMIDESNLMIADVNAQHVIESIREKYKAIEIAPEELTFYIEHTKINLISQFLLHSFYSKQFHDSYAIYIPNERISMMLLIYLKKIFQISHMPLMAQIATSKITSRYKGNTIRNNTFLEMFSNNSVYKNIIDKKFKYIRELDNKDDPILVMFSAIINSTFEFVDPNPEINGYNMLSLDLTDIANEFLTFLSII